jgi:hypothetical protein
MKVETKLRKKAMAGFRQISTAEERRQQMHEILQNGIEALNAISLARRFGSGLTIQESCRLLPTALQRIRVTNAV